VLGRAAGKPPERGAIPVAPYAAAPPDDPASVPGISDSVVRTPWERCVPAHHVPAGLGRERMCLLGVGLALSERPALVRDNAFLQALGDWWAAAAPDNPSRSHAAARTSAHIAPAHTTADRVAVTDDSTVPLAKIEQTAAELERAEETQYAEPPVLQPANAVAQPHRDLRINDTADIQQPPPRIQPQPAGGSPDQLAISPPQPARAADDRAVSGHTVVDDTAASLEQIATTPVVPSGTRFLETGVATDLGGVLFLINLMAHLELPECFEPDWHLATSVGPWGVLDALGRGLLNRAPARWIDDRLWAALAELDGRAPGNLLGVGLRGDASFRLPAGWLALLGDGDAADSAFFWADDGTWMRLWSTRGYLLLECPVDAAPEAAAHAALRDLLGASAIYELAPARYAEAPLEQLSGQLVADVGPQLRRWLALALPAIRLRLMRALNRASDMPPDIERELLQRSGRLHMTSTHIDLVMPLDAIARPARLAGLDRDPGWMPDFGRVIKFYFE
jgi:hypothetical protein